MCLAAALARRVRSDRTGDRPNRRTDSLACKRAGDGNIAALPLFAFPDNEVGKRVESGTSNQG